MEKKDIRTYTDYIDLKNVSTKPYLMISELIDNSVSSFDNKFGKNEWKEKLVIEIDVFFSKNSENTKMINDTKTSLDSYIKITDNAYGMTEKTLIESIRLNKKNTISLSKMNKHGRGLKQSVFYFSPDLSIETINEEKEISKIDLWTSEHNSSEEVTLISEKLDLYEDIKFFRNRRGTAILMNKIYANKFLTPSKYESLIKAISYRYIKLIQSNKMEINYKVKEMINMETDYNNLSMFMPIEKAEEHKDKVISNFDYNKTVMIEKIRGSKQEIKDITTGNYETKDNIFSAFIEHKDFVKETTSNIEKMLLESVEEKNKYFEWEQKIDVNGKELDVRFWRLTKNNSPHRGYRVYEGDRALQHPPISSDEDGNSTYYKGVFPASHRSGSTDNRFAGEFDISQLNATTATDKSKFIFEDSHDEYILNTKLQIVYEIFNIFEMRARSDVKNNDGKKISDKNSKNIETTLKNKFRKRVKNIEINTQDNEVKLDLSINKETTWKLEIIIDSKPSPRKLFTNKNPHIDDLENNPKLELTIYTGHKLWQKVDKSNNFMDELIMPISVVLGHYLISKYLEQISDMGDFTDIELSELEITKKINESAGIINE